MHALMLRASGPVNINAVVEQGIDSGIEHVKEALHLVDATIRGRWEELASLRKKYQDKMGAQNLVDALTVASSFNGITRIADASGIPVDPQPAESSIDLRSDLGIDQFHYDVKTTRYA